MKNVIGIERILKEYNLSKLISSNEKYIFYNKLSEKQIENILLLKGFSHVIQISSIEDLIRFSNNDKLSDDIETLTGVNDDKIKDMAIEFENNLRIYKETKEKPVDLLKRGRMMDYVAAWKFITSDIKITFEDVNYLKQIEDVVKYKHEVQRIIEERKNNPIIEDPFNPITILENGSLKDGIIALKLKELNIEPTMFEVMKIIYLNDITTANCYLERIKKERKNLKYKDSDLDKTVKHLMKF